MFRIVLGEGGGIAGTWEGYTISGSGAVFAWKGRLAGENEREVGRLPADTMCALWEAVQKLKTVPSVKSSGSLVRYLQVAIQETSREYSWKPMIGMNLSKTQYQEFHDRCIAAIRDSLVPISNPTIPSKK